MAFPGLLFSFLTWPYVQEIDEKFSKIIKDAISRHKI